METKYRFESKGRGEPVLDVQLGGNNAFSGAVVLTTHERCGYFTSVLGENIDLRLNPRREGPLADILHNVIVAGGNLVIIDEAFFIDVDEMARGLEAFVEHENDAERLRIIIVCTQRHEGDDFLAFLVGFCGIYDIIYGVRGVGVSVRLSKLLLRRNTRADVLNLVQLLGWQSMKEHKKRISSPSAGQNSELSQNCSRDERATALVDHKVELDGTHTMHVRIEVLPKLKK